MGIPSTAKRISRVFSRIPSSAKIWLSPRIEDKNDPLRTPSAYVVYGLTTGFIPFIKDDCLMPLLRGGAAIGLEFEVSTDPNKKGVLPIEELLSVASDFNPEEPSCSLTPERGFSFEKAAIVLKFQNRLEAIAAGPANLYNAYLNVVTSDERAHEAYHRILFEKFLRQKRLAPRAMNSKLDKELNRRANLLQAHRLFVFTPEGDPVALNRSLLDEYGLTIDRLNNLRKPSSPWNRWVIEEVFGMDYDNYMSRLRALWASRAGDESTGSPAEQESRFEIERRDVEGLLAGYLTIV